MNILKEKMNELKDKFTKTELERKLKEATKNEHCHASLQLLEEISQKSQNFNDFQVIMKHISKKLDARGEKWRRILKTLFLIEHLLRSGAPNFVESIRSEMSRLKYLTGFTFYDSTRVDKGETIREKSKFIISLLEDKKKIKEEREKFANYKNRIEGVSSDGKIGSISSSSFSNSTYNSSSYSNSDSNKTSKKKDDKEKKRKKSAEKKKEESSSSSSPSPSPDQKKKKKAKKDEKVTVISNPDSVFGIGNDKKDNDKLNKLNIKKPSGGSVPQKEQSSSSQGFSQNNVDIDDIFNSGSTSKNTNNNSNTVTSQFKSMSISNNTQNNNSVPLMCFEPFEQNTNNVSNKPQNAFNSGQQVNNNTNNLLNNIDSLYGNSNTSNQIYNYGNKTNVNNNNQNNQFNFNQGFNNVNNNGFNSGNNIGFNNNYSNNNMNVGVNNYGIYNNQPMNNNFNYGSGINNNLYNYNQNNFNNNNFSGGYNMSAGNNMGGSNNYNNSVNNNFGSNSSNSKPQQASVGKKPADDEFTGFDDGGFGAQQQQDSNGKPLSKLLDPKLVNLSNLKGNNSNDGKNNYGNNSSSKMNFLY